MVEGARNIMKYKVILYYNERKICEGTFNTDLFQFQKLKGRVYAENGFKIAYEMLDIKKNKEELDKFLQEGDIDP